MKKRKKQTKSKAAIRLRKLVTASIFAALAYVCVILIRFPADPITIDLKDAIMAIGALYLGPVYGIIMPVIVALLEWVTISSTGWYGFVMNVLSSVTFCFVSSLIYKKQKKLFGAVIGLVCSVILMTAVMIVANRFITPFYFKSIGNDYITVEAVVEMLPTFFLPINLVKGAINASMVMLLYKPFSRAFKASGLSKNLGITGTGGSNSAPIKSIIIIVLSLAVLITAMVLLFNKFDADVLFGYKPTE